MARRTRLVLLIILAAVAVAAVAVVAAAEPSVQEIFARARRALRAQPASSSEADSPSLTGVDPNAPAVLALPASSSEADSPSLTGLAPNSPVLLALPAAPTGRHGPPPAPPAAPTSQQRALPSGRTTAPTCTFVTYIGGGGTDVTEVVRGGDGRVFVVGPGSPWDKTLAGASHQAPSADAPDSDDSSEEEEEEEEDVFTGLMDSLCEAFAYARTYKDALELLQRRAGFM